jgi:hypothetical protein
MVAAGAVSITITSCATIAGHDEYAAYRRLHIAREQNERLEALARYAERFPTGLWIEEVRAERNAKEPEIWSSHNATAEGLQFYLAVYPDGTYVQQAQQRLAALSTIHVHREVEQEHVQELHQEQRQQAAEDRRLWVTRAVQFWTRTLLGIRNYGQSIGQVARANAEFSQAFGQVPAPLCTPTSCIKHYHARYAIPVPGATRIEREIHVFLRILLEQGRVQRVELLIPNKGFSRWYELVNRTVVTDEDPDQRQAALTWALEQLEPVMAEAFAGAQAADVIPAPISPISAAAQAASAASVESDETAAPGAPASETPPPASSDEAPGTGGSSPTGIDELLSQAVGPDGQSGTTGTPMAEEPPPDVSALTLPLGLRAVQRGNVRMVIFAAGDEDYAEGYDGFYIEVARD